MDAETRQGRPLSKLQRRLFALAALSLLSILFPKLSFAACFFTLVGVVATSSPRGRISTTLLGISFVASSLGLLRFAVVDAIPGVVAGGKTAVEKQAVSFLRTIVTAQDHVRLAGLLDPDADGIGSALTLEELAGLEPIPAGSSLSRPPLALAPNQIAATARGNAARHAGYLFIACVPESASKWSTRPTSTERDFEAAERRYLLYAWPESLSPGSPKVAYFADQHERILMLSTDEQAPRYVGTTRPPPCEAALGESDWQPWKEKEPRKHLPGDSSPSGDSPAATE